ncbi:MAG: threonine dehydratase [Woeseiaceae bacterium]|nr:threonine dehydratase [Woeseiaceae bacterium]
MFDRQQLNAAANLVHASMLPTPALNWPLLSAALGSEVWVKHENHTPTGAFKVRGGIVYIDELVRAGAPAAGLITATRGNHGQSIPWAARAHGIPVRVLVPEGNSQEKNAAMAAWGADVEVFGTDFDEARVEAERLAAAYGSLFVRSFHEHLVRGVATYALELFEAVAALDTVYVPIGMGSGICGVILVRDLLGLETEVVGVVSDQADAVARSFEAGSIVETDTADTFADGMACRVPAPDAMAIINRGAARIVRVSEDDIADAVRLIYTTTHNVAEGAGAAACAAAAKDTDRGDKTGVVLTGGNIDRDWFATIIAGGIPRT